MAEYLHNFLLQDQQGNLYLYLRFYITKVSRPILKIELSKTDKLIENIAMSLLVLLWLVTFYFFMILPDIIPMHFDMNGKVNGTGNKATILLPSAIVTILFIGFTFLNKYPHVFNYLVRITPDNAYRQYANATRMIRVLKLTTVLVFISIISGIYSTGTFKAAALGGWFLVFTITLVMLPILYFTFRSLKEK